MAKPRNGRRRRIKSLSELAPDRPTLADEEWSEMSENGKTPRPMPRLKERYQTEIVPALMKEFGYANVMQSPRLV